MLVSRKYRLHECCYMFLHFLWLLLSCCPSFRWSVLMAERSTRWAHCTWALHGDQRLSGEVCYTVCLKNLNFQSPEVQIYSIGMHRCLTMWYWLSCRKCGYTSDAYGDTCSICHPLDSSWFSAHPGSMSSTALLLKVLLSGILDSNTERQRHDMSNLVHEKSTCKDGNWHHLKIFSIITDHHSIIIQATCGLYG